MTLSSHCRRPVTHGSGDATTVAGGVALLADNADYASQGYRTILIEPGTYTGTVTSGNRYGVHLVGATSDPRDVVITAGGTGATATRTLTGAQWAVRNLTVANTNNTVNGVTTLGTASTALQVKSGDKDVFDNVRFLGDKPGASITDSSVDASNPYGFLITDSAIVTDAATAVNAGTATPSIYLGRPCSTTGKAQVVVRGTSLDAGIVTTQPWKDWDATTRWTAGRFFEYANTGAGAAIPNPANRPQLSDADAANFTAAKYLAGADGWNPLG